jgi:hypothetical protein
MCSDNNGLCIKKQGDIPSNTSGYVVNLAQRAQVLTGWQEDSRYPVILIEADQKRILIQRQGNVTVSIHKNHIVPQQSDE